MDGDLDNDQLELLIDNRQRQITQVDKISKQQIIPLSTFSKFLSVCCCNCCIVDYSNTENEYKVYHQLLQRTQESYNEDNENHEKLLKMFYDKSQVFLTKEQKENEIPWKVYGFDVTNPRSDFKKAGLHSLAFMCYFIENYPKAATKIFQKEQFSFVSVSNKITFKLRCYLLLKKGKVKSKITRRQMKSFVYNLVKDLNELLFKIEAIILLYYLEKIQNKTAKCINTENKLNKMTSKLICQAISICGIALKIPINSPVPYIESFETLIKND